jgi:[1-hydroxy-2-(trimethylamino)ethyl]phosphonate dioxygenase
MNKSVDAVINTVFGRFKERGHLIYDEAVTELQHALQAATFAERDGQPPNLVVACLLHDYGRLCLDFEEDPKEGINTRHEEVGAAALSAWFPPEVIEPGRLHVAAKRYLCAVDEAYTGSLSPASLRSLQVQGGKMSIDEIAAFESEPFFRQAVALRYYDDMSKIADMETPDLEHFRPVIAQTLQGTG